MADATHPDSWWYDGGGLYRHVRLVALNDIHFAKFGIYAPSFVQSAIQAETQHDPARADAVVIASVEVERYRNAGDAIIVVFEVLNEVNQIVASEKIIPLGDLMLELKQWEPILVSAANGDVFDLERTTFGIRKLHWDPDLGFFINDVNTKILGVANHQDFAGLGVAIPDSLQAHRIAKIQELGGNAWRTAHNAPNVALLDATDRMGMLVWDENHRNGEVENAKLLVKRDRNHPSIIIWSICNEILCDCGDGVASKISLEKAVEIKDAMQTLDPHGQRVISANQNEWIMENSVLDLLGFDYATNNYDFWHALLPTFPAISSETSSALSDRGEYEDNQASGHVSAFDTQIVPWDKLRKSLGHFGIYDIAGFDKDRVGWYKSWWPLENNKPHVDCLFLFPHWNWALNNAEAQRNRHLHLCESNACVVEVRVYSNAACVELFLNGQTQGRQAMPRYGFLAWNVTFAPGNITARSYASCGDVDMINEVARVTTGPPAKLRASFKDSVGADGINADEVALIQVVVLDAFDRLVPVPNEYPVLVRFEVVAGAGKVIGTGNGDPADLTCDKSPIRKAYHGRLLGIVQGDEVEFGKPGDIEVVVSADGFDDVLVAISLVRSNPTRTSL
ncbi:arogenate dehydratase [Fragilaria crotonensis]|nr:arogenate dehydratase [Fragilaria crotonensis]